MARNSFYTKELGAKVASQAQAPASGQYHVISRGDERWAVVPAGRTRAVRSFPTQRAAIIYAKSNASKKTGEVIVHAKSGQIKDTISYAGK